MLSKALKSCPKSNKSPNLVTLVATDLKILRTWLCNEKCGANKEKRHEDGGCRHTQPNRDASCCRRVGGVVVRAVAVVKDGAFRTGEVGVNARKN